MLNIGDAELNNEGTIIRRKMFKLHGRLVVT